MSIGTASMSFDFFARGLHTRTAVAHLPLRQLGFLVRDCYQCSVFCCVPLSTHMFVRLSHSVINILYLVYPKFDSKLVIELSKNSIIKMLISYWSAAFISRIHSRGKDTDIMGYFNASNEACEWRWIHLHSQRRTHRQTVDWLADWR